MQNSTWGGRQRGEVQCTLRLGGVSSEPTAEQEQRGSEAKIGAAALVGFSGGGAEGKTGRPGWASRLGWAAPPSTGAAARAHAAKQRVKNVWKCMAWG